MAVVISPDSLRSLGSDTSYERGLRYANEDRVGKVSQQGTVVRATVAGREPYRVRLVLEGETLAGDCACPMGAEGEFCKHCVALAIVWSAHGPDHRIDVSPEYAPGTAEDAARALSHDDLVDLVVGQAGRDAAVAAELYARAGMMPDPDDSTLTAMRARVVDVLREEALEGPDLYYDVEALVEELAHLVRSSCSAETVALVEEAANRWAFIESAEDELVELRELETLLDEILQEARHLVTLRKPLASSSPSST